MPKKDPPPSEDSRKKEVEELADRPLECTECRKSITIWYTEIVGNTTTETCMCDSCPELQRHLQRVGSEQTELKDLLDDSTGLCCGECGTTLSGIRMGHPIGCAHCYEVFKEIIFQELCNTHKIPASLLKKKINKTLHIGHKPGQTAELSPSLQLIALNEALKETLGKEDYEQAAWLRDQINELTESDDE